MQRRLSNVNRPPTAGSLIDAVASVSEAGLRRTVEDVAVPRHPVQQRRENRRIREYLEGRFEELGFAVSLQGEWQNVVAERPAEAAASAVLIGAHYDSVALTPGADDNASGIAALLACAEAFARHAPEVAVRLVAFNGEEDGLLGSSDYVDHKGHLDPVPLSCAHILEMVGFCSHEPGSQRMPLPLR